MSNPEMNTAGQERAEKILKARQDAKKSNVIEMKLNKFFWAILSFMIVLYIGTGLLIYRNAHPSIVGEDLICETRYIGATYKGTVLAKDGDYIYLSGTSEVVFDCTIIEEDVTEYTPLCGTYIPFNGILNMGNLNCYRGEDDIKGKLKAYKNMEDDAEKEEKKYYTCDLNASIMVDIYNSCETVNCATNRIREYLKDTCPRANIK